MVSEQREDRIHELEVALTRAIERMRCVYFQDDQEKDNWELVVSGLEFILNKQARS